MARARTEALEVGRLDADYELLLTLAQGIGVRASAFFLRLRAALKSWMSLARRGRRALRRRPDWR